MQRKHSILFTLMSMILVVIAATSVIFTLLLVHYRTKDLVSQADARLLEAAEFGHEVLGPDYHDRIVDGTSVSKEEFRRIVARNDDICQRLNLQYLWSVLLVDNRLVFTSATHSNLADPNSPCASFFETHSDPKAFVPALSPEGKTSFSTFRNEWGKGRMVLVPRKDAKGRTYIFGASVQLTELNTMVLSAVLTSLGLGLIILAGALFLSILLARSFVRPISQMADAAKRMATGDLDVPLVSTGPGEVQSLASSLDQMRQGLKAHVGEIRESQEKFKAIANYTVGWESWFGPDGKYLWVNPGVEDITGYSPEEIMGMPDFISILVVEEDRVWLAERFRDALLGHRGEGFEFRFLHKNGAKRWLSVSGQPIFDEKGKSLGLRVSGRDVTKKKEAEKALQESEEKFKRIFESANVGKSVTSLTGKIDVNKAFCDMLGYAPEELINKTWQELTLPDETETIQNMLNQLLKGEKDSVRFNKIYLHKNGSCIWADVSVAIRCDPEGKPLDFITTIVDITERKQAEDELRRTNSFLNSVVENIPDMIFLKDARELRFVRCNRATEELLGYSRDDLLGKNDYDFFPKEQADFFTEKDREVLHRRDVVDIPEETIQTRVQGERILHTRKVSLVNENGEPEYMLGISEDVTDHKRMEGELRQSVKKLQAAMETTVQVLGVVVETRDPYTAGHQRRVTDLACAIATDMHLPSGQIEGLYMAGSIHDIGKISIPSEILCKPGALSPVEHELLKAHAVSGAEILKNVTSPWPLSDIVWQHHERIDGSGYPRGLKGDEMLIEARILAVADVVESMASHRPYRPALGVDAALEEIEKNKGVLYDQQVSEACITLFRERRFAFE